MAIRDIKTMTGTESEREAVPAQNCSVRDVSVGKAFVQEAIVQEAIVQETIVQETIVQETIVQEAIVPKNVADQHLQSNKGKQDLGVAENIVTEASLRFAAMSLLAQREHSRFELKQKLSQRFSSRSQGASDPDALVLNTSILEIVLQQLSDEALQSDARFAEAFTAMRVRKGQGPIRIGKELEQRQVNSEIISRSLEYYDDQWVDLAQKVYSKKYPRSIPTEVSINDKAKQMRFLQYRGFSGDHIHAIWK